MYCIIIVHLVAHIYIYCAVLYIYTLRSTLEETCPFPPAVIINPSTYPYVCMYCTVHMICIPKQSPIEANKWLYNNPPPFLNSVPGGPPLIIQSPQFEFLNL